MRDFLAERDSSRNPQYRRHYADDPLGLPLGPGEQAQLVELYRLKLAAEAQKWRNARRCRQQAGSLADRDGMRAWRASP